MVCHAFTMACRGCGTLGGRLRSFPQCRQRPGLYLARSAALGGSADWYGPWAYGNYRPEVTDAELVCLRSRRRTPSSSGNARKPARCWPSGRVPAGLWARVVQRLLALNAAVWPNWLIGAPVRRSLIAYGQVSP